MISHGKYSTPLTSPRSSLEYSVKHNASDTHEYPSSIDMRSGDISDENILKTINNGIYISNLWYLNFSDRNNGRMTGLTRFGCFIIENGELVAPIETMRFDDSIFSMLGDNLIGLTKQRELLIDSGTYEERSTSSSRLPGALIDNFKNDIMTVKTRFAPSPTGWLHIGGVRTALYSWLYAKKHNGDFYLRIDDTDTTRSTIEYRDSIISALDTLGLNYNEIIYQSERFNHYIDKIELLLESGHAYYDKTQVNEKTKETDLTLQFDNRLNKDGNVIRFKNQRNHRIELNDSVHGEISFETDTFFDVVILRSNGIPTYNLTSVVDDIDLGITHLIRGDDHLSNIPIQINLFNAFDAEIPHFSHLPMIHGLDGKRLSKRHGAVDINHFLNEGYRVDAILNYLAKTGWSHGDQEIFSRNELIDLFSLDRITKSAATFDIDKLNWLNQYYIKTIILKTLLKK